MGMTLYPGIPFSPQAALVDNIGAVDTIIKVSDIFVFPPAPNYATIGTDEGGETILYTAKVNNALSGCQRGVEGVAKAWTAGELIGRNFTAKDHADMIEAIRLAGKTAEADGVTFADGKTFQQKLDGGDLTGQKGELGERGPQGEIGPVGPVGPKGERGEPGAGAYELAVAGGFSGTEEELQAVLAKIASAQFLEEHNQDMEAHQDIREMIVELAHTIHMVPIQLGSLAYNEQSQSPTWNGYNTTALSISGDTTGTNVGEYTVTFTPKEGYKWWDGTTDAKSSVWSIKKANADIQGDWSDIIITGGSYPVHTVRIYNNRKLPISVLTSNQGVVGTSVSEDTAPDYVNLNITGLSMGETTITVWGEETENYNRTGVKSIKVTVY